MPAPDLSAQPLTENGGRTTSRNLSGKSARRYPSTSSTPRTSRTLKTDTKTSAEEHATTTGPCGAAKQVVRPHALERLADLLCEWARVQVCVEVLRPGQEGEVVVGAEVVQIFDEEPAFYRGGELAERGDLAVREDVGVDPGVGGKGGLEGPSMA